MLTNFYREQRRLFSYTAYGLGIHSFMPLPELIPEENEADVVFQLGNVSEPNPHTIDEMHKFKAGSNKAYYSMEGAGSFVAQEGQAVIFDPAIDADEHVVRLCLLGPALALILHQRQHLVLHASAVACNDAAILFLGGHGWGKSTLAAALHFRGYNLLTDDITPIKMDCDLPKVLPGFPQCKLWPDA